MVDQHRDVAPGGRCAQDRADALVLVDEVVQVAAAVVQDHFADQRIAERPHERRHRPVGLFRIGGSGDLPVAVVGRDDDDLPADLLPGTRLRILDRLGRTDDADLVSGVKLVHLDDFNQQLGEFEVGDFGESARLRLVGEKPGMHEVLNGAHPVAAVGDEKQPEQERADRIADFQRKEVENSVKNAERVIFRVNSELAFFFFLFCHRFQ